MKKILYVIIFLLLIGFVVDFFGLDTSNNDIKSEETQMTKEVKQIDPPSKNTMELIQGSLDSNGEDRWMNWKVAYNEQEETLFIQVAADPRANNIAINGYIDLIKKIHNQYADNYDLVGRVYQMGDLVESCYVNAK